MRVGISNDNYPEKRTIKVDPNNEYVNFKYRNIYSYINFLTMRILKKKKVFVFKPLCSPGHQDVDIFHLFNDVAITDKKWLATFETDTPRILFEKKGRKYGPDYINHLKKLVPYLAADNCLALIALSKAALHMQQKLLLDNGDLSQAILKQTVVMHPPQKLHTTHRLPRDAQSPVHFVFIGNEFFRKGGGEVVQAFCELIEESRLRSDQVKVTLIGDLKKTYNYALNEFQDDEAFSESTLAAIAKHDIFTHHSFMPNESVLALFQEADIGLLPTWAETYGFSVLEMQSCGCPVITTNVRALPEINPESVGWQVVNTLNDERDYEVRSEEEKLSLRQRNIEQLKTIIMDVVANPDQILEKANAAIQRIKTEHDLTSYREKLRAIYNQ